VRTVSLIVLLTVVAVSVAGTAEARCRYLVISVDGEDVSGDTRASELILWPTPESLNSDTVVRRTGRRFRATVQYYPRGVDATGTETCASRPEYISVRLKGIAEDSEIAKLSFPSQFKREKDGTWRTRKRFRIGESASQ
jgi:hypothetical protein